MYMYMACPFHQIHKNAYEEPFALPFLVYCNGRRIGTFTGIGSKKKLRFRFFVGDNTHRLRVAATE